VKLTRIDFDHVDGVPGGLTVDDLSPGLNVVLGDNGAGKSTLVSVVCSSLWPQKSLRTIEARSHWELEGGAVQRAVVRGQSVSWSREPDGALSPLPPEHLRSCYMLSIHDLLGAKNQSDQELAKRIRRAMRGGFDLDDVRKTFPNRDAKGRKARGALRTHSGATGALRREFRQLAEEEDRLHSLRHQTRCARDAEGRLQLLETAAALLHERQQLTVLTRQLAEVPAAMASLTGGEADQAHELQERLASAEERAQELRRSLQDAESEFNSTGLGDCNLDAGLLHGHRKGAQGLATEDVALTELRSQSAAAEGSLRSRRADLSGADTEAIGVAPGAEALDALDQFLLRCLRHHENLAATSVALEQLGESPAQDAHQELSAAVHALRRWLRIPGRASLPSPPRWTMPLGTACIAAGIGLGLFVHPILYSIAGLGIGLLLGARALRAVEPTTAADGARVAFEATGQSPPSAWDPDPVAARLTELEQALANADRALRDEGQRRSLKTRMQVLQREEDELRKEQDKLRETTGLAVEATPLALVETARRLAAFRDARAHSEALLEQVEAAESRLRTGLTAIVDFLKSHGSGEISEPSAVVLQEQLEDLRSRHERLGGAQQDMRRIGSEIATHEQEILGLQGRLAELFSGLGLQEEDTEQLDELITGLRDYKSLQDRERKLSAVIASREEALLVEPDWLLLDEESLAVVRSELQAMSATYDKLNTETERIQNELLRARAGKRLEDATATQKDAEETLYQVYEEALHNEAAQLLLDRVEGEFEESSRPEVLRKAREHFSTFTRMAYEIEIGGQEQPRLLARDTSTLKRLELGQLSDATRIQLLLAVRLAFSTTQEQDAPLPLFLDEALSTSDPGRFAAVSGALVDLIEAGRQIFYLTANPADLTAWQRICADRKLPSPHVVELGSLRDEHSAVRDADHLRPWASEVPAPGDLSAAEYGALLAPPRPDRFAPVESLDLFYPAMDQLPLVFQLRCNHIKTTGQWLQVQAALSVARYVEKQEERAALAARVLMARRYLENWRIGRGKPLTAAVIEASGLVSGTFLTPVSECLEMNHGEAQALLDAIDDKRIKRFRANTRSELEDYLLREGFLDRRKALSSLELEAALLGDLEPELEAATIVPSVVRDFVSVMDRVCASA